VQAWFAGGDPVSGAIKPAGEFVQHFRPEGESTWMIYAENAPKEKKVAMAWRSFATAIAPDPTTYGYEWNSQLVTRVASPAGDRVMLPEYYRLQKEGQKAEWVAATSAEVPAETGLKDARFDRPREEPPETYDTPEAAESSWKRPGPSAGPFNSPL
jgi:hypothetical protein